MYCRFYGLKERPFNVTSDPSFFFLSQSHKEALSHLLYGVSQRKGIIVITGEIGAGKTTLCRAFLNQLNHTTRTAFILNPYFSDVQLLEAIVNDFGIKMRTKTRLSMIWELNKFLLHESQQGNNVALIIDEAQNLKPQALEQVRLLSNLETEKDKLLQIILVGQPELKRKLKLRQLRQLQQRIAIRYHIPPLEKRDITHYIYHRLGVAANNGNRIHFTDDAIQKISDFSRGVPRLINIVCDRALLAGFNHENFIIDIPIIKRCLDELGNYYGR
jgi:general secretion pathway protein A